MSREIENTFSQTRPFHVPSDTSFVKSPESHWPLESDRNKEIDVHFNTEFVTHKLRCRFEERSLRAHGGASRGAFIACTENAKIKRTTRRRENLIHFLCARQPEAAIDFKPSSWVWLAGCLLQSAIRWWFSRLNDHFQLPIRFFCSFRPLDLVN